MFVAIQDAIIARLTVVLGSNPVTEKTKIITAAELSRVPESRQFAPAVHVIYGGHSVGEQIAGGRVQSVVQNWLVVCTARNAIGQGDPAPATIDAGKMGEVVLGALLGFDPLGNGAQLRLADAPGPEYDGGYCYLPLNFRLRSTFKGIP